MPIFFQDRINETTRLGIWKIEETEHFFKGNVPQHRDVTHPHKRLQHLAGRFLLQFLFPDFPYHLIQVADTRRPYLPNEEYHFSISHCGDYAAAIVSKTNRVGIDIETPTQRIIRIKDKFLNQQEKKEWGANEQQPDIIALTLLWSCKEAVFKWYGYGGIDFSDHIQLFKSSMEYDVIECQFAKHESKLSIHYRLFDHLTLAWVLS
jgi:phosphopantetheinyl transferase